jgi:hypothetical protein
MFALERALLFETWTLLSTSRSPDRSASLATAMMMLVEKGSGTAGERPKEHALLTNCGIREDRITAMQT